jgi:hypothetical protein
VYHQLLLRKRRYQRFATGFAEGGEEPPPVMEFLSSGEGLQLSLAFMRIKT